MARGKGKEIPPKVIMEMIEFRKMGAKLTYLSARYGYQPRTIGKAIERRLKSMHGYQK